jgi:DNA-binding response OmpR family regulator
LPRATSSRLPVPVSADASASRHPAPAAEAEAMVAEDALTYGDPVVRICVSRVGEVVFYGQRIDLQPMAWRLLLVLCRDAQRIVSRRKISDALWPEAQVEDQQIDFHKRRLVVEIAKVVGIDRARQLVIARKGAGLFLAITPDLVVIDES